MENHEKRPFPIEKIIGKEIQPGNVIYIGNFDAEKDWQVQEAFKIPFITDVSKKRIYRYCDELIMYLAGKGDMVILRQPLDTDFKKYLIESDINLPQLEVVSRENEANTLTQLVLEDNDLLERLTLQVEKAKAQGEAVYLAPYCITANEIQLASRIGACILPALPSICAYLNNKKVARNIAAKIGFTSPRGMICKGVEELKQAYVDLYSFNHKIVIKELFGVGGGGLIIIDSQEEFNVFCERLAKNPVNLKNEILIEAWYDTVYSLNCQFLISDEIHPYAFSQQVLDSGIFVGSLIPAEAAISREEVNKHRKATFQICKVIQDAGYRGVVGIDTISTENEDFYAIDINARLNISTFFNAAKYLIGNPPAVIGRWFEFKLTESISFNKLLHILGDSYYNKDTKRGYFILNFNSLNINTQFEGDELKDGRIYMLIAGSDEKDAMDQCHGLAARIRNYNEEKEYRLLCQ